MPDYPFSNWEDFFEAFRYVLFSPISKEKYKKYIMMIDNSKEDTHVQITRQLLEEKNDAQEGLDRLVMSVVYGHNEVVYGNENENDSTYNSIRDIYKLLISHGAVVKDSHTKFILKPFIGCFDHNGMLCEGRAVLLHIFETRFGLPSISIKNEPSLQPSYQKFKKLVDVNSLEYIDAFHATLKYKIGELRLRQIKSNDLSV